MAWSKWQERLFRIVPPLALAVTFWGVIGLLVVFATAEGKDSPFTAFFTAFGAMGQTFFAFMVWRLSREQFAFTKKVSDRQARIDGFEHRHAAYQKWKDWRQASMLDPNEERLEELSQLSWDIGVIFNDEAVRMFDEASGNYMAFMQDFAAFKHAIDAEEPDDVMRRARADAERSKIRSAISNTNLTLFLREQVRLEADGNS